jgi:hypothetical protein
MFCPRCQSEYRAGYTRCVPCDIELVATQEAVVQDEAPGDLVAPVVAEKLADYCGFLDLEEAREVRNRLLAESIGCEIAIRTSSPGSDEEDYWLRVDRAAAKRVAVLLGDLSAPESAETDPTKDKTIRCSKCRAPVQEEESFCANCGTRFS